MGNSSEPFHKLQHLCVVGGLRSNHLLMPFCTVAACFQECETRSTSQLKSDLCSVCEWDFWDSCYANPHIPIPSYTSMPVLKGIHWLLHTANYELIGMTGYRPLSTALLWHQYCSCVSLCLFYSLVFLVWYPSCYSSQGWCFYWTNGVKLWIHLSSFSSHVALEVTCF